LVWYRSWVFWGRVTHAFYLPQNSSSSQALSCCFIALGWWVGLAGIMLFNFPLPSDEKKDYKSHAVAVSRGLGLPALYWLHLRPLLTCPRPSGA